MQRRAAASLAAHVPVSSPMLNANAPSLADIERLDEELKARFELELVVHPALTRSLVSFQANKGRPIHRWYKYKEAFSASLVEYLFERYKVTEGRNPRSVCRNWNRAVYG